MGGINATSYEPASNLFEVLGYVNVTSSLFTLTNLKDVIPSEAFYVLDGLGIGGDYLADFAFVMHVLLKLPESKRLQKDKALRAAYNFILENVHTGGKITTLLSQHGVLQGLAASVLTPAAGFAPAVVLWGRAIASYYDLYHSVRHYDDAEYMLEGELDGIEVATSKLEKLNQQFQLEKGSKKRRELLKKIAAAGEELERMQRQVVSITQVKYHKKVEFTRSFIDRFNELSGKQWFFVEQNLPTEADKKLVAELKKNQEEKVIEKAINSIAWTTAAIGMTLLAVAPFAGPAAPALVISGITIAALAGAMKLGSMLISRATNYIAKDELYEKEKHKLLVNYKTHFTHDKLSKIESYETKLGYVLYAQQQIKNNEQTEDQLTSCYDALDEMAVATRRKLLSAAISQSIDRVVLGRLFKLDPDKDSTELDRMIGQLSKKQKQQIIHRSARSDLRLRAKSQLGSFFSLKKSDHAVKTSIIKKGRNPAG